MYTPADHDAAIPVALLVQGTTSYLLQVQTQFRRRGMHVITAGDGLAGLQSVHRHFPDVIVADVDMPHLSGYGLCWLLKSDPATAGIPVILLQGKEDARPPSWHAYAQVDHLLANFEDPQRVVETAWREVQRRQYPGAQLRAAVDSGTLRPYRGEAVIEDLLVQEITRTEVSRLAHFTTAGNRHELARAMFDVLSSVITYHAAGVFFLQPTYATFFLHTRHELPPDTLNALLDHAVVPTRELLQGTIRLVLFSGDERAPRELGRWTPPAGPLPQLPILRQPLQRAGQTLGSLALIAGDPSSLPAISLLSVFAEGFSSVLAGLYLFEEYLLLRRAVDVTPRAAGAASRNGEPEGSTPRRGTPSAHPATGAAAATEPIDLLKLVGQVCGGVSEEMHARGLRFEARLPAVVPPLALEGAGIATALSHLLKNAMAYTQSGGAVTLWVIVDEQQVRIAVQDTGIGIEAARQIRLFSPANTDGEHGGAGASGLVVSKALVEAQGGTIIVDSAPGKGSLFIISLPACARIS